MKPLKVIFAAVLLGLASTSLGTSPARATTVDFEYLNGSTAVATGSFTYASGDTGVLSYADLSAFSVTVSGKSYDLAAVTGLTDYVWFGYSTLTHAFTLQSPICGFDGCNFTSSLSAINSTGSYGFFFTGAPGAYQEYQTGAGGSFTSIVYSTVGATPLPSTWTMLIAGFAGLGFFAYRGTKKNSAAIAAA
ncbi:MAG: hypothetical protein ACLQJ0_07015 [Steroidobacteraceae bacterium]